MSSASTSEVFNCSVQDFYKIISDYNNYPEFLSEVKSCKVVESTNNKKLVEYEISLIKTFKYRLLMTEEGPSKISWVFDSGDLFKASTGSWTLSDEGGKTKAVYSIDASFNVFVPGPISKALVKVNLPNMMACYHKRVKALYGQ